MSVLEESASRPTPPHVSSPCSSKVFAATVDGKHVDFAFCVFGETDFLCITEYQKLGTVVQVEIESSQVVEGPNRIYNTRVLLGEDSEEVRAAARFLAEQLATRKQLIVTLALKRLGPAILKKIVPFIQENTKESRD